MSKATLEFDLQDIDSKDDFELYVNAKKFYLALSRIKNEIFRPYRKHGYSDHKLPWIDDWSDESYKIVSRLEEMFYEILEDEDISSKID